VNAPTTSINVAHLPTLVSGARAPLWWGMLFLVLIECLVFGAFIAGYLYLRFLAPEWPPAGIEPPDLLLPTVNSLILIGSSVAIYFGDKAISERGDQRGMLIGVGLAALFGLVFVLLKVVEYYDSEYYWDSHAYGSVVWTMIVFHSSHVVSVLLKAVVVLYLGFKGHFTKHRSLGVKVNGLYWHFVVVIWIPLYLAIYWAPRISL
jgi:cytochrome c oxidase subunit III